MLKDKSREIIDAFRSNPKNTDLFSLIYFDLSAEAFRSKSFIDDLIDFSNQETVDPITRFIYGFLPSYDLKEYVLRKYLAKAEIISDWAIDRVCEYPNQNLFKTMCRKVNHYSKWKIIYNLIRDSNKYPNSYELLIYLFSKYNLEHFNQDDISDFLMESLDHNPIFLKLLFKNGASPNQLSDTGNRCWLPILAKVYKHQINELLNYGSDPFFPVHPNDDQNLEPVPLYHYLIENDGNWLDYIKFLNHPSISKRKLNTLDSWNRNILHIFVSRAKKENFRDTNNLFYYLVDLGADPDKQALIDNQQKVVTAKLNGTLPKDYGKTPREILISSARQP